MAGMNVLLDDNQLKQVIAGAILQTLTQEKREELIQASVVALLNEKEPGNSWGSSGKTRIQIVFERALEVVALEEARKLVETDPSVREKLRSLFVAAFEKATVGNGYDGIVEKLASAVVKGLTNERY